MSRPKVVNICVGDVHLHHKPIKRRSDNFLETCFSKLATIALWARQFGCPVSFGGDLGHNYSWSPSVLYGFAKLLREFSDVPFYTIYGNHDLYGGSFDRAEESSLTGVITLAPNLELLNEEGTEAVPGVYLYGISWTKDRAERCLKGEIPEFNSLGFKGEVNIVHAHLPVGPEEGMFSVSPTELVDSLMDPPRPTILCFSDIHIGFSPIQVSKNLVMVNPGMVCRRTSTEFTWEPRVLVILSDGSCVEKPIPHDPEVMIKDLPKAKSPIEFIEAVKKMQIVENSSVEEAILTVVSKEHPDFNRLILRLSEIMKDVEDG